MKTVVCNHGEHVLVDDEDFDFVNQWRWGVDVDGYAVRWSNKRTIKMHRLIISAEKGIEVDHVDGNIRNNQKSNLRLSTHGQNQCNIKKLKSNNTHGVKGAYLDKRRNKWFSQITSNGKTMCIGSFDTKEEAAERYDTFAKKLHGEFAVLNSQLQK